MKGSIVNGNGEPVAHAEITYYGGSTSPQKNAFSNDSGEFHLDDLPIKPGESGQLIIRARGWAPVAAIVNSFGTKDQPAELSVWLNEKAHSIKGRVINARGEPIQGAYVEGGQETSMDDRGSFAETDHDGRFEFDSLASAKIGNLAHSDTPQAFFDFSAKGYTRIEWKTLPLDGNTELTVTMQPTASIVGTVVDADTAEPVPKFNIRMRCGTNDMQRMQKGENFSSVNGKFRLDDVQTDEPSILIVSADGYPVQYFDDINAEVPSAAGGDSDAITLKLSKHPADQVRIAGRITDSNAHPIAEVEVRAVAYMPTNSNTPDPLRFDWGMLKSGQLAIQDDIRCIEQTRTAADGTFEFPSIRGPEIDLAFWGQHVPPTRIKNIATLPAEQREHLQLTVSPPATLTGNIDRNHYPNVSFLTLQSKSDPTLQIELTIPAGADHYEFSTVPAGAYRLEISGKRVDDPNGTFHFESLGYEDVQVNNGESHQLDLVDPLTKPTTTPAGHE